MIYCGTGRMFVGDVKYVFAHNFPQTQSIQKKKSLLLLAMKPLVAGSLWIVLGWRRRSDQGIINDRRVGLLQLYPYLPTHQEGRHSRVSN